jgi:8-oxo-dGTP pyrophosphatase MutT (NUDIX family)
MEVFKCDKGCCSIKIKPYTSPKDPYEKIRRRRRKAGVFIYDPATKKVLLVQSRGHWWGPPKGSMDYQETERMCAVREVYEETGLKIPVESFTKATNIINKSMYFYSEMPECEVKVQDHIPDNDVNGIGWIKLDCLADCLKNGNISLSNHCRIVFYRFMCLSFPDPAFVLVEKKRRVRRNVCDL